MRNYVSTALLCLFVFVQAIAQSVSSPNDDSQYIIEDSVMIRTGDGVNLSALVVRKKDVTEPQAAIMQFTIYARKTDIKKAKTAADHGYVGVIAYSRGKRYSYGEVFPYEHDGRDAYEVIDWITKQPWSNQKVGMFGGSYNGFTQWASTKKLHPALKTIVPSASVAPGLDVPMTNNVSMSFVFSWTYYVSNNQFLDEADYNNPQWNNLYWKWFEQGKSYRSLDSLLGRPGNKIFHRWLNHPTYDSYWQSMIPYKEDFSKITIPVLTTTGYFDGGQIGATYYLREHQKYNPKADHHLLIGPYGHFGAQGFPDSTYMGYKIDPVANISIHALIYQWFDYVLKNAPKPTFLKDKINYQVMGSNEWKHVPSLNAMSNDTLTFYLSTASAKAPYRLSTQKPSKSGHTLQMVDFKDRDNINSYYYLNNIIYDSLNTNNGLLFVSDPLTKPLEISGCFTGNLEVIINKKDMDCNVVLFEVMPDGKYFYLSYFMGRASYAKDIMKRQLLTPGKKESIPFTNSYMTSRKLSKGSRIAAIININKSPFEQINYGTGKDINTETIKDATVPLQIKWLNDSYLKIPVWR
ncbi:CocE/NonD family hydrolase [Runella sp.]|uniref:CocE/NonD family hydrolase n=1 Tax=Runella sp. TaxID=1960881 RepID=UPI003D11AC63